MRGYTLIEFLMGNYNNAEIVVYNTLGDPVSARASVLRSKESAPQIVITASAAEKQPTDPLTLNAYQDYAFAEAIYPDHGKGTAAGISLALAGLIGEAGAGLKQWHDIMRGGAPVSEEAKDAQRVALGHAFWFVAALAKELNCSLSELGAQSIRQARAWRREHELQERQQALTSRSGKLASAGDL